MANASANSVAGSRSVMTPLTSRPERTSVLIAYQVSKICRPVTPWMVSMLKMIFEKSTVNSCVGVPSSAMRPPWVMLSIMDRSAAPDPDISRPMSKPSCMSWRAYVSAMSSRDTLTVDVRPSESASASRSSDMSVMTTLRAPWNLATSAAMIPIGPAPVTRTSSASAGNCSAACTALPNGSKIAATSGSMPSGCTHTLPAGIAKYSQKAPSTWYPMPRVLRHR